jgi:DNA-binding NarL/FixJ family response regulator
MNKYLITEHNVSTGIVITREMTENEQRDFLAQQKLEQEISVKNEKAKADKIAARESALAKLVALGLTEDEIAAL